MSLMRGEYRHPKYVFGWLKLFLHIAFYTVVRRKITRERKLICRTLKHLLETGSAASLKTAITPVHCSIPPSLPSRLSSGLPQPYGISITPIGCNRVVECAIQHCQRRRCSFPKSANIPPSFLGMSTQFSSRYYRVVLSYSRRPYTPHVATNPVNSTPDHDPDKH